MNYLGMAVVLLALWPSAWWSWRSWRRGENRLGAVGVVVYSLVGLALAYRQFFLR